MGDHTRKQLGALDEFDADLRKKIQRLLTMQAQAEDKRQALNEAHERGQAGLKAAHVKEVTSLRDNLERTIQAKLQDAAKQEGFALSEGVPPASS